MASPFIAEIRMGGWNFAPRGWAFCSGQILSIAQNTALFSLLGTTYGGNGQTTFALPDLRGRTPIGEGQGPGLSPRSLGEAGGQENVTLLSTQLPAHTHAAQGVSTGGTTTDPNGAVWASSVGGRTPPPLYAAPGNPQSMAPTNPSGGSQPHSNLQPLLAINFVIALQGIFPSRN
jgi:microcystin-dependent protein